MLKSWFVSLAGKALYAMQKFKLRMKLNRSPDMCLLDGSPVRFYFWLTAIEVLVSRFAVSEHGIMKALTCGWQTIRSGFPRPFPIYWSQWPLVQGRGAVCRGI